MKHIYQIIKAESWVAQQLKSLQESILILLTSRWLRHPGGCRILWRRMCTLSCSVLSSSLWPHGLYITRQAPLSVGFPRQEYWSGLPFPAPGDLPDPGIKPTSLAISGTGRQIPTRPRGKPIAWRTQPLNYLALDKLDTWSLKVANVKPKVTAILVCNQKEG